MFSYFTAPNRAGDKWFSVGLASSFPDLGSNEEEIGVLAQPQPCRGGIDNDKRPGCKAFHVPKLDSSKSKEVPVISGNSEEDVEGQKTSDVGGPGPLLPLPLEEQVLVFRYKGKFHAVDHVSNSVSLSLSLLSVKNQTRCCRIANQKKSYRDMAT